MYSRPEVEGGDVGSVMDPCLGPQGPLPLPMNHTRNYRNASTPNVDSRSFNEMSFHIFQGPSFSIVSSGTRTRDIL